ncbi:MAG: hypothetical protein MJ153_07035 [Clostridia bacterium]|nr:hypothetical protein [Clostridia bacterium]
MSDFNKERNEAICAGENALRSLRRAKSSLSSARGWGIYDILKGKSITGFIKHSKLNDARADIEQAKWDIERFRRELNDLDNLRELNIDVGTLAIFADFVFDGLIADIYVQSKIKQALNSVEEAIRQIEDVLRKLR